ncbi:unnamed protein product [Gordionus sp. m RMFG-2023]
MNLFRQYKERIEKILFTYVVAAFIALGIIGNIFYFVCINRITIRKSHTYIYIRSLIITDFSVCVMLIIWPTYFYSNWQNFNSDRYNIVLMGKYIVPVRDSFMHFSNLLRVLISLDRVVALALPVFYNKQMRTKIKYLLIITAIISAVNALPNAYIFKIVGYQGELKELHTVCNQALNYTLNDIPSYINSTTRYMINYYVMCLNSDAWFKTFGVANYITMFALPVIIIVIANTTVIVLSIRYYRKRLKKSNINISEDAKTTLGNKMSLNLKRIVKTINYQVPIRNLGDSGRIQSLNVVRDNKVSPNLTTIETNSKDYINRRIQRNREFKITLSMMALSTQFVICMLPLILLVFKYHFVWNYDIMDYKIFWFQAVAHILKLSNYCLSVYIYLLYDRAVVEKIKKYMI